MTIFDVIALGLVAFSALSGYNRGVVAEILGLFAMAISAMATIAFLPATAPIVRHMLHSGWLSAVVAAVITFVVVFMFLRILAATLTQSVNRSLLGGANRFGGLAFGALRGVVFLALIALLFNRVTPDEQKPRWITGALTYPLVNAAGHTLQAFLPNRLDLTGGFGDKLTRSITEESIKSDDGAPAGATAPDAASLVSNETPPIRHSRPSTERAKPTEHGYTRRARDSVDSLVERSK